MFVRQLSYLIALAHERRRTAGGLGLPRVGPRPGSLAVGQRLSAGRSDRQPLESAFSVTPDRAAVGRVGRRVDLEQRAGAPDGRRGQGDGNPAPLPVPRIWRQDFYWPAVAPRQAKRANQDPIQFLAVCSFKRFTIRRRMDCGWVECKCRLNLSAAPSPACADQDSGGAALCYAMPTASRCARAFLCALPLLIADHW